MQTRWCVGDLVQLNAENTASVMKHCFTSACVSHIGPHFFL